MDLRRDLLPPLLALSLSAALHGGLGWWNPRLADDTEVAEPLPVVLEYLPAAGDAETAGEGAAASSPERPAELPPSPPEVTEPAPAAAPPREFVPEPVPEVAADAPRETPSEPEPAASPALPTVPLEPASTPPEPPPAEPAAVVPQPVPLADLLPRPADLKPYTAPTPVPDPAGSEAREATLTLGEADIRYRGYLDQVQGAIDVSTRWKEAVLMEGRGGRVLVHFTLNAQGQIESVNLGESSGSALLDNATLEAVRAAKIPQFPTHWTIQRLHLSAEFDYRLVTF